MLRLGLRDGHGLSALAVRRSTSRASPALAKPSAPTKDAAKSVASRDMAAAKARPSDEELQRRMRERFGDAAQSEVDIVDGQMSGLRGVRRRLPGRRV